MRDFTLVRLDERFAEFLQVAFLAFMRTDGDLLDAGTDPGARVRRGAGLRPRTGARGSYGDRDRLDGVPRRRKERVQRQSVFRWKKLSHYFT